MLIDQIALHHLTPKTSWFVYISIDEEKRSQTLFVFQRSVNMAMS